VGGGRDQQVAGGDAADGVGYCHSLDGRGRTEGLVEYDRGGCWREWGGGVGGRR
jgi:hypothetical protein